MRRAGALPVLRWAAAAAVLLGTGYGLARFGPSRPAPAPPQAVDVSQIRAQVALELREELRGELAGAIARVDADQASRHEMLQLAVAQALGEFEARQIAQHAALRKDVETVALRTQQGFEQIAVSAQPPSRGVPSEQ
jgi:hypothetical protein